MPKLFWITLLSILCLSLSVSGEDLYRVSLNSQADADNLISTGVEPVLIVKDGYLVLADSRQSALLSAGDFAAELVAKGVSRETLALDNRPDKKNLGRFPMVYELDGLRLFQTDGEKSLVTDDGSSLIPIRNDNMVIRYRRPVALNSAAVFQADDLQGLIDKVAYDSVYAYLHHLQAFDGRVAGTSSNYAARDWLQDQLQSYGYTNVQLKSFYSYVYNGWKQCYNVIAYKEGTVFPNRQVVVGAHFDAVPGSPGADDNGSGSVGVLEIARALADVETEMSFVFVLFDSEEQGLNGAWDYANIASSRGDSIICMLNMDMIGHFANNNYADVKFGPVDAYARLWTELSDSLVNITGYLAGSASNSDHHAFVQNGYDVLFAAEHDFSNVYHTPQDSTTYINFDYMTRMIKATLATAYTIDLSPMPVRMEVVRDGGDGQSLQAEWYAEDPDNIDHYRLYYMAYPSGALDSMVVGAENTSALITGLTEDQEYLVYVVGVNSAGYGSIVRDEVYGTPRVLPAMPQDFSVWPEFRSIRIVWNGDNTELDFSHYVIIRDGEALLNIVTDTFYVDNDYSLGADFHDYIVVAVDFDGNYSDTVGVELMTMRAATLEPGRILAVNRSNRSSPYMVDETVTGEFMRDALTGYDYVYLSDTSSTTGDDTISVNLEDMLDYEVIIFGGEAARTDDFANDAVFGGILDTIGYYLSIGGKVIMFGRWGDITTGSDIADTIIFGSSSSDYGYRTYFHMDRRVRYLTAFDPTTLNSDFTGTHSQAAGYPDLVWDSMATVNHSLPWSEVSGIPCPSFGVLTGGQSEILYTYDSRSNFSLTEGKPVAWRYSGPDAEYAFFEIPLSFMERSSAKAALLTALSGLISTGPAAQCLVDPDTLDSEDVLPPTISVLLGEFSDLKTAGDVDQASILINGDIAAQSVQVLSSHPDFVGEVVEVVISTTEFLDSYGSIIDTANKLYTVSWSYMGEPQTKIVYGQVTLISEQFVPGDANGDLTVNVADAVYLINYVFKGGPQPEPVEAGDANCDGFADVGDAVYLIGYVFRGGPPPGCD